ncbi:MAG: hypothetical protein HGB02_04830 [Chlorobiaceae bacterium]|nr:hypothetical protein [Chlorobiaceae bacterium]
MKRKLTIASLVSLCTLPLVTPSNDASAIPAFARKYGTSCYTCHSGFPARNAFGEAFKNNGYRWPGGEDEDKTKQDQLKMGADGWKKTFPESPWPAEIPGYAPISLWVRGNLADYATSSEKQDGTVVTPSRSLWGNGVFNNATIFFGGTMGDNLSALVQYNPTAGSTTGQLVWTFRPGLKLAFGNGFTDLSFGNATNNTAFASALVPAFGNATGSSVAELVYIPQDYLKFTAGVGQAGTNVTNSFSDLKYFRARYKVGGAGLLSGAGGTYGNEFVGLDNNITFATMVYSAAPGTAAAAGATASAFVSSTGVTERLIWEADVTGSYGNFLGGLGFSRSTNISKSNIKAEAAYFLYPWLKGSVVYTGLNQQDTPTVAYALTTHVRANASLAATYTQNLRQWSATKSPVTTGSNQNTIALAGAFAF